MKTKTSTRLVSVILAVFFCFSMMIPAFAEVKTGDVSVPLKGITVSGGYTLSPAFQQNTQVYTVKGVAPADEDAAKAVVAPVFLNATDTVEYNYNKSTQTLTMTVSDAAKTKSSIYYVSFSDIADDVKSNVADINVKKILEADENAKLDKLSFTFELTQSVIVENTTVDGNTVIPLANELTDDNADNGTVTASTAGDKSTMVMTGWDKTVPTLSSDDAAFMGRTDLEGHRVLDGTFSIEYDKVGQYKYILHEVAGTTTGVTYDEDYYEVTVSVVHSDPNDPTSDVVVGWIEVALIKDMNAETGEYTQTEKVNFGEPGINNDGEKYDNMTASITYPYHNILATEDLIINKTVTGDLGDASQLFLFKLEVSGKNLASSYAITYTDNIANDAKAGATLPDKIDITNGETDTGVAYFTLYHNSSATIAELPVGAEYVLTELVADVDGKLATAAEAANYNTTINYDKAIVTQEDADAIAEGTEGDDYANSDVGNTIIRAVNVGKTVGKQSILDTKVDDANRVEVINDKPLTPPTGAFIDMVPYIAIVVFAVCGITAFAVIKKRHSAFEA